MESLFSIPVSFSHCSVPKTVSHIDFKACGFTCINYCPSKESSDHKNWVYGSMGGFAGFLCIVSCHARKPVQSVLILIVVSVYFSWLQQRGMDLHHHQHW